MYLNLVFQLFVPIAEKNLYTFRSKESISAISNNDTCLSKVYVQTNVIPNFLFVIIYYRLSIT